MQESSTFNLLSPIISQKYEQIPNGHIIIVIQILFITVLNQQPNNRNNNNNNSNNNNASVKRTVKCEPSEIGNTDGYLKTYC